ncbi:Hypothetical protein FKW44_004031, partial [Caligus rogercresseyi]
MYLASTLAMDNMGRVVRTKDLPPMSLTMLAAVVLTYVALLGNCSDAQKRVSLDLDPDILLMAL